MILAENLLFHIHNKRFSYWLSYASWTLIFESQNTWVFVYIKLPLGQPWWWIYTFVFETAKKDVMGEIVNPLRFSLPLLYTDVFLAHQYDSLTFCLQTFCLTDICLQALHGFFSIGQTDGSLTSKTDMIHNNKNGTFSCIKCQQNIIPLMWPQIKYITLKYIAFDQNKKQIPHYDDHCILFIIFNPYLSHPHSASLSVSVYNT